LLWPAGPDRAIATRLSLRPGCSFGCHHFKIAADLLIGRQRA
jgi:hypothetical protein